MTNCNEDNRRVGDGGQHGRKTGAEARPKGAPRQSPDAERDTLFLHSIVENIPHMVFVKDADELRFVLFNRAGEELLGLPREQLIGCNDYDLFPPAQAAFFTHKDRQVLASEHVLEIPEEPIDTPASGTRYLFTRKIPLRDSSGEPRYLLGISLDVTERRMAEVQLRRAKEAAEAASRTKDRFLANMSHEMRTPLNGVMGGCELLASTKLTPEQREYVSMIQTSTSHLTALINDILDLTKVEAGKLEVSAIPFSVRGVLASVQQILDYACEKKRIFLVCHVDDDVPDYLRGDPDRLRQVLLNLANNAIKFTEQGEVAIAVETDARAKSHATLRFTVKDTGIGLSEGDQTRVFESFTQVDSSIRRRHDGAGLGLAISRQLCQLMGGDIGVHSELGQGSTFWFTVAAEILPETSTAPESPAVGASAARDDDRAARGYHILVVEDNPINQKVARGMLRRLGYETTVAGNGHQALSLLERHTYDLVLMDCQMPVMDGFMATEQLRARESADVHVPVIAMTAMSMAGDRDRCLAVGMDDYIAKPLLIASLREVLDRWLPRS